MDFFMKLPRNKKESMLFITIISVISVNIIAPLITCYELGFGRSSWMMTLGLLPKIWIVVVLMVLMTFKPAAWLTSKLIKPTDSFGAHMMANTLCSVLLLSLFLTIFGSWIGTGRIDLEPIKLFFYKWPRNFSVAFAVECLIAQPIARMVMQLIHRKQELKTEDI